MTLNLLSMLQRRLRRWYARNGQYVRSINVNGIRLYIDIRSGGSSKRLFLRRMHEEAEVQFLQNFLRPGMNVVDVGANLGYLTCIAARLVGNEGYVVAFEPDPLNFALLSWNVDRNHLHNVHAYNMALGSSPGVVELFRSDENFGDHRTYETPGRKGGLHAVCERLDAIDIGKQVNLVKLDVQGFECRVLAGMAGTLEDNPEAVVIAEYSPAHLKDAGSSGDEFFGFFRARDYLSYMISAGGETKRFTNGDLHGHVNEDSKQKRKRYLNIVFAKRGVVGV